jgi:hypothetical protein
MLPYFNYKLSIPVAGLLLCGCFVFVADTSAQIDHHVQHLLVDSFETGWAHHAGAVVYLQTSKGIYETGEDLWFKAYVLGNQSPVLFTQDTTLYVELLRQSDHRAVWQQKYLLQNGMATGQVYLYDTLTEGDYLLAACSRHSFYRDSTDFHALRKVIVRKNIIPELKFTWSFAKGSYNPGDTVVMKVRVRDVSGNSLHSGRLSVSLWKGETCLSQHWQDIQTDPVLLVFGPEETGPGTVVKILAEAAKTSTQASLSAEIPYTRAKVFFRVFPEGGYLLYGVPGVLAFCACDDAGRPVEVTGTLYENDRPLLNLHSRHNGMGSLSFTPGAGKNYSIRLQSPMQDSTYHLDSILAEGLSLHLVRNDSTGMEFLIRRAPSEKKPESFYLRAQTGGAVCGMASGRIQGDSVSVRMEAGYFPQGITEVTLFNGELHPVAERLVYAGAARQLYIEAETDSIVYHPHSRVIIRLKTRDAEGKPVRAVLAMSVFDRLFRNQEDAKNIVTHYYLSTQLKGRIYDPQYYFEKGHEGAMDLLLLTQGWRRYVWGGDAPATVLAPVLKEGTGVKVRLGHPKKQKEEYITMLFTPDNPNNHQFLVTDTSGRLELTPQYLSAGPYVYVKPMAEEAAQAEVKVLEPFAAIDSLLSGKRLVYPVAPVVNKDTTVPAGFAGYRAVMLDEVIVKSKTTNGGYRDKYMGSLDSIAKFNSNTDFIGVPHSDTASYKTNGKIYVLNDPHTPLEYRQKPVEGKIYHIRTIHNTPVTLDNVLPSREGGYIIDGIKEVVYHYPKFTEEELLKKNHLGRAKGYYSHKEFYQPDYDNPVTVPLPDSRNTLDWEPYIITDDKGQATVSFFCSDVPSFYSGNVEGLDTGGLLGATQFEFRVKEKN